MSHRGRQGGAGVPGNRAQEGMEYPNARPKDKESVPPCWACIPKSLKGLNSRSPGMLRCREGGQAEPWGDQVVPVVTESKGPVVTCCGHSAHLLPDTAGQGQQGRGGRPPLCADTPEGLFQALWLAHPAVPPHPHSLCSGPRALPDTWVPPYHPPSQSGTQASGPPPSGPVGVEPRLWSLPAGLVPVPLCV